MKTKLPSVLAIVLLLLFSSCKSEDDSNPNMVPQPVSPVVFDINAVPYPNLADYNFFDGDLKDQNPVYGVIPYETISTLFTDYAKKKRFVWMPEDTKATYNSDGSILDFPVGTILIKTFYYNNVQPSNTKRIIETRLMIKKQDDWIFADYIWDDNQTEATYSLEGGNTPVEWMQNGTVKNTNYRIPTENECFICHKNGTQSTPIGVKPQNLNKDYSYSDGTKNQLQKLIDFGYLDSNIPSDMESVVDWKDTSQPIDLRMRSYLDINCAHCHSDLKHCDYRPMRFAFNETADNTNIGVCVEPEDAIPGLTNIIEPGNKNRSVLYYRFSSTEEDVRMPLLGRTIIHEEAVVMVEEWINSITTPCN